MTREARARPGAGDVDVRLVGVSKHYGEVVAVAVARPRGEARGVLHPARPVGLRQDDHPADDRRLRGAGRGPRRAGGKDVTGLPPYDRSVNTVFQDYALFPHMTVGDNVAYGLRVKGVDKAERRRRATRGARDGAASPATRRASRTSSPAGSSSASRWRGRSSTAEGPAARRAARRPRPEAARADAGGAEGDPGPGRDHVHLRDPRPGGGPDDVGPHRRLQRWRGSSRSGPPTEIYERPGNAFVAGFVGVSNLLERDGQRFTVRPEKITIFENGRAPQGLHVEEGTIKDVSYAGMITAISSTSRRGESFKSSARTWRRSSAEAQAQRGRKVKIGWRADQTVAVKGEEEGK